jgi:hypothetical protein
MEVAGGRGRRGGERGEEEEKEGERKRRVLFRVDILVPVLVCACEFRL